MKTGKEAALQKGSSVQRRAYFLKVYEGSRKGAVGILKSVSKIVGLHVAAAQRGQTQKNQNLNC